MCSTCGLKFELEKDVYVNQRKIDSKFDTLCSILESDGIEEQSLIKGLSELCLELNSSK